MDICNTCK